MKSCAGLSLLSGIILMLCFMPASVQAKSVGVIVNNESMEKLATMLSGEFDSHRQMRADKLAGVKKEQAHGWVNRVFMRVEAPEVADVVLVGSTRYNGPPWYFDKTEFLVWTLQPSDDNTAIVMSPRRFKNLEERIPYAQDVKALSGFTNDDLEPAISGAACDILWVATEAGFKGHNEPCTVMSTTQKVALSWRWSYQLEADALWVEFSGQDASGKITYTTPPGNPYRLERLSKLQKMEFELTAMLSGEFESRQQMLEDQANKVAKEKQHFWVNRAFMHVDAPKVDIPVLVGTTFYNGSTSNDGSKWIFDNAEFLVWTFAEGDDDSLVMYPRQFKEQSKRVAFSRDAKRIGGFGLNDLESVENASKCHIVWTRLANGFQGISKPCRALHTPSEQMADWVWNYRLTDDALWVEFSGINDQGDIAEATPQGHPYRLDRINQSPIN